MDEHSDSLVIDRLQRARQPHVASSVVRLGGLEAAERRGQRGPAVRQPARHVAGTEPGYLGVAHRPFTPSGPGLQNLQLANGVTVDRMDDRKALLSKFDDVRRDIDASGTMAGLDELHHAGASTWSPPAPSATALDLTKEEPKTRDRYKGVEQFLTARRLVEAGVGCVTLSIGGWDTHRATSQTLRKQLPQVDRGIANLIQDLHDRGMAGRRRDGHVGRVRPDAQDQHQPGGAATTGRRSCRR